MSPPVDAALNERLGALEDDYRAASATGAAAPRVAAARRFRAHVSALDAEGGAAVEALVARIRARKAPHDASSLARLNAAAAALSFMSTPRAAEHLVAAALASVPLHPSHIARLGRTHELPEATLPDVDAPAVVRSLLQPAVARAWFRYPASGARSALEAVSRGHDARALVAACDGLARWDDGALLRRVLEARGASTVVHEGRCQAAFWLAMRGERDGVERLVAMASDENAARGGAAVARLSWLGQVCGVALVPPLLRQRRNVAALGLDAARAYHAPRLGPPLLELAERLGTGRRRDVMGSDVGSHALWTLAEMLLGDARLLAPDVPPWSDIEQGARVRALRRLEAALATVNPTLRYRAGAPLTIAGLVDEITMMPSLESSPRADAAAHNLEAMTGEDHGYEAGDSLIGNLDAIDAWRGRTGVLRLPSGAWMFRGDLQRG